MSTLRWKKMVIRATRLIFLNKQDNIYLELFKAECI